MHFLASRREFRERAVVYFGFCACIPLVRIVLKAMFEKQGGMFYMNANGGTENQL